MANMVSTVVDDPMDFTVIANSPKEMETAQRSLILWAARKIQMVKNEIEEAKNQFRLHQEKKWSTEGWRSQILKHEKRAEFYRKIKTALEAGYYIVPPFPVDVFAIRTKRKAPQPKHSRYSDNHNQPAQILAIGEGRYVDPRPLLEQYEDEEKRGDKLVPVAKYFATEFQDVDFPFKLARAEIREMTDQAMALKVFDRMGALPRTRSPDPIIVGQILVPNKPRWGWDGGDAINFFVTWWLDTKTL